MIKQVIVLDFKSKFEVHLAYIRVDALLRYHDSIVGGLEPKQQYLVATVHVADK